MPDNLSSASTHVLRFSQPASCWEEALPIGNGSMAAMVLGGTNLERYQLNEESLWEGHVQDCTNPEALSHLAEVRRHLLAGDPVSAEQGIQEKMMGRPNTIRPYQTLGDLSILVDGHLSPVSYCRELRLRDAEVRVSYESGGTFTKTTLIASHAPVFFSRWEADVTPWPDLFIRLERPDGSLAQATAEGLLLEGQTQGGLLFAAELCLLTDGQVKSEGAGLRVTGARWVEFRLSAATSYRGENPVLAVKRSLADVSSADWSSVRSAHQAAHQHLYNRCELRLSPIENRSEWTLEKRLNHVRSGGTDTELEALLFHFGRYLLISSSRPGCLPANLQGKWNPHLQPPWNSDYHLNINLQMNYWPAEATGLSECHLPLFDYLESLVPSGRRTAKTHYDCAGFVVHHLSDIWGFTAPADSFRCGLWVMGGAWTALHFWDHWLFSRDRVFLRERAQPILREAALFLLDYLIELPNGELVTAPSSSPENGYLLPDGSPAFLCVGATMDLQICREVFLAALQADKELNIHDDVSNRLEKALPKLPPNKIGPDGRLQEWREPHGEPEPGHRHISHLFALHPGHQISPEETPELAAAARRTIEYRLSHGGGHTGWSRAWLINFEARLQRGAEAYEHLQLLLRHSTLPNLFDDHPPFQIDGNFGACAGMAEMLAQSTPRKIRLLPALPPAWQNGSISGLRTRCAITLDLSWRQRRLTGLVCQASTAGTTTLIPPPGQCLPGSDTAEPLVWEHSPGGVLLLGLQG